MTTETATFLLRFLIPMLPSSMRYPEQERFEPPAFWWRLGNSANAMVQPRRYRHMLALLR